MVPKAPLLGRGGAERHLGGGSSGTEPSLIRATQFVGKIPSLSHPDPLKPSTLSQSSPPLFSEQPHPYTHSASSGKFHGSQQHGPSYFDTPLTQQPPVVMCKKKSTESPKHKVAIVQHPMTSVIPIAGRLVSPPQQKKEHAKKFEKQNNLTHDDPNILGDPIQPLASIVSETDAADEKEELTEVTEEIGEIIETINQDHRRENTIAEVTEAQVDQTEKKEIEEKEKEEKEKKEKDENKKQEETKKQEVKKIITKKVATAKESIALVKKILKRWFPNQDVISDKLVLGCGAELKSKEKLITLTKKQLQPLIREYFDSWDPTNQMEIFLCFRRCQKQLDL